MFLWGKKPVEIQNENLYEENTEIFIEDFSKLIKKKKKESIKNLIKFMANSVQGELLTKCFYNDRTYSDYINNIVGSLLLDLEIKHYQKLNNKMKIAETPLISCIWNHSRVIDNLCFIGTQYGNTFDGDLHKVNVKACLIEPLGLVIVTNGNHSVNSAIIHNEGEIVIDTKMDISPLLEKYEFNGKYYINRQTKEKIELPYLKNSSEPFTYTLGLFFEMARVLKKLEFES